MISGNCGHCGHRYDDHPFRHPFVGQLPPGARVSAKPAAENVDTKDAEIAKLKAVLNVERDDSSDLRVETAALNAEIDRLRVELDAQRDAKIEQVQRFCVPHQDDRNNGQCPLCERDALKRSLKEAGRAAADELTLVANELAGSTIPRDRQLAVILGFRAEARRGGK